MTYRTLLAALVGVAPAVAALPALEVGCGQAVATCSTICALSDAPSDCDATCRSQQTCAVATDSANFQAYLTCVSNAGVYSAGEAGGLCEAEARAVDCFAPGSGSGSGSATGAATSTSSLPAPFDDAGPVPIVTDAGPAPTVLCTLGDPCEPANIHCDNPGAGPCGSDELLTCGPSGQWVADGFACSAEGSSCGFATSGANACSETCSCEGGQLLCTGDCPDAG